MINEQGAHHSDKAGPITVMHDGSSSANKETASPGRPDGEERHEHTADGVDFYFISTILMEILKDMLMKLRYFSFNSHVFYVVNDPKM